VDKQHPHLGATYRTFPDNDGTICVEVVFPVAPLVKVTGFRTEALATAWIAGHKRQVATGTLARVHTSKKPKSGAP
jgi:hypothetical protein